MEIPIRVVQIADDIKAMRIRGAGKIARAAAEALKVAALEYRGPLDESSFKKYIAYVANLITSTRPTAVSLHNAVLYVMSKVRAVSGGVDEMRSAAINAAEKFIQESIEAVSKISVFGAKRIKNGAVVLTHCHSAAAVSTIINAYKMGKVTKVYSTETRPFFQGRITARQLLENGVPVIQIPDSAVRYVMNEVDHVVVGADTVASNGAVINKIGTSQVALAAHEARVRVFIAAETYKFSPMTVIGELVPIEMREAEEVVPLDWIKSHPGLEILNPSFDVTPPEYIDAIVTEVGVIPPQAAISVLVERLGWALEEFLQSEHKLAFDEV